MNDIANFRAKFHVIDKQQLEGISKEKQDEKVDISYPKISDAFFQHEKEHYERILFGGKNEK